MLRFGSTLLHAAALGSFTLSLAACGGKSISAGAEVSGGASSTSAGGAVSSGGADVVGGASNAGGALGVAGDGALDGSCSRTPPVCDGSIVGAWSVYSSCLSVGGQLDLSLLGIGCATTAISGFRQVTGDWSVYADGTYEDHTRTTGADRFELGASCLAISGTHVACDAIGPLFESFGYRAVSCVPFREGSCSCSAFVDQSSGLGILSAEPEAPSGRYTVAGNVITLDGQRSYAYCSAGGGLTLTPRTVSPTLTGSVAFASPLR